MRPSLTARGCVYYNICETVGGQVREIVISYTTLSNEINRAHCALHLNETTYVPVKLSASHWFFDRSLYGFRTIFK